MNHQQQFLGKNFYPVLECLATRIGLLAIEFNSFSYDVFAKPVSLALDLDVPIEFNLRIIVNTF